MVSIVPLRLLAALFPLQSARVRAPLRNCKAVCISKSSEVNFLKTCLGGGFDPHFLGNLGSVGPKVERLVHFYV